MRSLGKTVFLAVGTLLVAFCAELTAQEPQPPDAASTPPSQESKPSAQQNNRQGVIPITVNQVIVPVTVKDGSGRIVPDLGQDEFRIFEDNVEQRIVSFRAEPTPMSVVMLIDNDLKSKDSRQVAASLRAIVAGLSPKDETFVCRFDQFFHPGKGFTADQDKLLTELKRTSLDEEPSVGPAGAPIANGPSINGHSATSDAPNIASATINIKNQPNKALDDAVYSAAQLLKDRDPHRQRRKIIFLISDGINGLKANTNKYDTVKEELLRHDISVYGVGVGSAFFERRFERLSRYAHDTGGDVYYALKTQAMEELYSRVTEEARNQYVLVYAPSGTDRGASYHSIEVRVKREGLTILAREGYFAGTTPR